ncbi:bactofilin family protein [Morganella psychrotolerans]|nr:polymer-forming cytoskeletal protein [Morganella psychrotolerans]
MTVFPEKQECHHYRSAMLNILLTSLWFLWGLLLYAAITGHKFWPVYLVGIVAVICLTMVISKRKRKQSMFGKKKQAETQATEQAIAAVPAQKTKEAEEKKAAEINAQANEISQLLSVRGDEKQPRPLASLESRQPTVISKETRLTGDIDLSGNLQIWGKITGQIKARSGTVSIMQSGVVDGDIIAETLLIDGVLSGTCSVEQLEILEHGELNGICRASNFSIRKGGIFIGQSEPYVAPAGSKTTAVPQTSRPEPLKVQPVSEPVQDLKQEPQQTKAPEPQKSSSQQSSAAKGKEPQKVPSVFKNV